MKKLAAIGLLVVLAVSLVPSVALAGHRVRIYKDIADIPEDLMFTVKDVGGKLQVFGEGPDSSDEVILTLKGNRIYQGKVLTNDNVLFTIKGDRIIPGVDSRVSNALYTVRNGHIYAGTVTTPANVLYSFDAGAARGRLYEGNSNRPSDTVYTIDGGVNGVRFLLPVLADGLF